MSTTTSRSLAEIEADIAAVAAEAEQRRQNLAAAEQKLAAVRHDIETRQGSHSPTDLAAAEHDVAFHKLGLEATRGPAFDLAEERRNYLVEKLIEDAGQVLTECDEAIDEAVTEVKAALARLLDERKRRALAVFGLREQAQVIARHDDQRINLGIGAHRIGPHRLAEPDLFPRVRAITDAALGTLNRSS